MGKDLQRYFEMALRRTYSAENQIYDYLNMVAEKATLQPLRELLLRHRKETSLQIDRLKTAFELLNFEVGKTRVGEAEGLLEKGKKMVKSLANMAFAVKSKGMEGAIDEAEEMVKCFEGSEDLDSILMAEGQALAMGEIAAYEVLYLLAEQNGMKEVASLLKSSLNEEKHMQDILLWLLKKGLQS
jgi:ferritin-like metal-binding protein YciE